MNFEKTNYESPVTSVILVSAGGFICASKYMQFGSGNASGNIDDDDVIIYGGSF